MTVNSELHIQNLDPIRLPIEIVKTIVDAALLNADESSNSKLISSIALLSRECRRSANRLRFSSVNFNAERSSFVWETRRIRDLSALVKSGLQLKTLPGVHTFITSFTVRTMSRSPQGSLATVLQDVSLDLILAHLYRLPPHNQERKYTLSLDFMDYISVPWGSLGENIQEQLVDLLRHSFLYEMRIYKICDIPGDLFHGSNIKSLVFENITIDNPNQPYPAESTAPIQLQSLNFDTKTISYNELLQLIGITTLTPIITGQAFSQLTSLSIQTNPMLVLLHHPVRIQELLAHTPKLEYLCIQTVPIMAYATELLLFDITNLNQLKTLHFKFQVFNEGNPFAIVFALLEAQQLSVPHASLETIQVDLLIGFPVYGLSPQLDSLYLFLKLISVGPLEELLSSRIYQGIKKLNICPQIFIGRDSFTPLTLNQHERICQWQEQFAKCIMDGFPILNPVIDVECTVEYHAEFMIY